MKNNSNQKKSIAKGKQIKLIINFISLSIFIFSYFYLYDNYVDKTESCIQETENMRAAIKDREYMLQEEDMVREQIEEVEAKKQKIIDSFPVYIGNEDNFMFVEQMEKALNIKTSSVTPSDTQEFFRTIIPAKAGGPQAGGAPGAAGAPATDKKGNADQQEYMTATVSSMSMSFTTDYQGFKDMVDYVRRYPDHTVIDSVSVSSDQVSGILVGNLVLKRFALTGTGKEYLAPSFEHIDIGMDNIFGSGD
jgi:hypothetical protein